MIEQVLSILAAAVVFTTACLRLNVLKAERRTMNPWSLSEVFGLIALLCGCAGSVGEWFLPNAEFHAETIVLVGAALFALGVSRGALCQLVARLQGWDGAERRMAERASLLHAHEFLEGRAQRRQ